MFKKLLLSFFVFTITNGLFAQGILQPAIFLDETQLAYSGTGTVIVNDTYANNGLCMFRASNSINGTIWYGPYSHVQAGNYLAQFRMKVSSNASSSYLCFVDIVSSAGNVVYNRLIIKPNMFKNSNEWQLITIPVTIPNNINDLEFRGMDFRTGVSDVYFDYVQIVPNDFKGVYSDEFTVSGNGNIGIGTITPQEKLSVNGKIRAQEVKVETSNWADYVFADDYKPTSLEELEKFIKINKHLPEIPSAPEAEKNGIELGYLIKKLLKQQEEFVLHLIEKDKEIKALKKENEEIKLKLDQIINLLNIKVKK